MTSPIEARLVDPRDATSEWAPDRYRVHFWTKDRTVCTEYELHTVDVRAAIAWADQHADGRTYMLYAVEDTPEGLRLIQLTPEQGAP